MPLKHYYQLNVIVMKKDIENRQDIELLVNSFYEKVKPDPVIGYIFTDIVKVNWERHLPRIYDFWENTVLYTGGYNGNPMELHRHLNRMIPLTSEQFKRWTDLFCATVDELFEGEKALLAKQRAVSISTVMQIKIINPEQ
jgi:hemoglobin